jgi:hypothetical protein
MGVLYEQFSLFELPDITSEQDTFSHHSYHRTWTIYSVEQSNIINTRELSYMESPAFCPLFPL